MKKMTLTLVLGIMLAIPVAAHGKTALLVGVSNVSPRTPEVLFEIGIEPLSSISVRGTYSEDAWHATFGWREYLGRPLQGGFFGGFITFLSDSAGRDVDIGTEIGYRILLDSMTAELSARLPVMVQKVSYYASVGFVF